MSSLTWEGAAFAALVAVGWVLRLVRYAHDRSLWGDEARLALNLRDRSFTGLVHPLAYIQAAPTGFLLAEKVVVRALGDSEYSLRLLPLAAGLASLAVFAALARMRWQPALRIMPPYYDDPIYIDALAKNLSRQLSALDFEPERLLLSFHGMPVRTLELGDPYHCHCQKTARLLGEALGREVDVAFQSRFGRAKWLEPATDATLAKYAHDGVKRIAVAAPGFSADCIETLEELGIRGRRTFIDGGGENFALLDCLNDSPESVAMLTQLISRELAGWREQA